MHHDAGDGLESGSLYLELQVLPSHFTAGPGVLILRCTSHVAALYMQSAEVSIGFPARDPIPARVTSAADKHILQKKIIIQLITALLMFFTINR
ncbi:uncharacterized protein LOC113378616 isoform X2 [Ctenocephalides felis]|nr:uncharacterized protein LOC113378616 isoform X2 [Ctenocephalides felis]